MLLDFCHMGFSPSFISWLKAIIIGANCLVSSTLEWGLEGEWIPKHLPKFLLFWEGSLSFLPWHGLPIFTFCWWEENGSLHLFDLTNFRAGSLLSLPSGFYLPPALMAAYQLFCLLFSFLLFLHYHRYSLHNWLLYHPPCLWHWWLLFLLPSLSQSKGHPKLLGHLLMRFKLEHLLNQYESVQCFPWLKLPTSFPHRCLW